MKKMMYHPCLAIFLLYHAIEIPSKNFGYWSNNPKIEASKVFTVLLMK